MFFIFISNKFSIDFSVKWPKCPTKRRRRRIRREEEEKRKRRRIGFWRQKKPLEGDTWSEREREREREILKRIE